MILINYVWRVIYSLPIIVLVGCGGGGGGSVTDNQSNQPFRTNSLGYAGGGVLFGGQKIVGEWSVKKLTSKTTGNSFASSSSYATLGIKFDDVRYYEYWVKFELNVGGGVANSSAWTPLGGYGVSRDGATLLIEGSAKRRVYLHKPGHVSNGIRCIGLTELDSGEDYELCKLS